VNSREQIELLRRPGGGRARDKLVHDTFHYFLAGKTVFVPEDAGIVRVSCVVDQVLTAVKIPGWAPGPGYPTTSVGQHRADQSPARGMLRQRVSYEPFATSVHAAAGVEGELR
jgi:2-keto-myo-inositol isomerase